jgi:hypothetical protein
MPPKRPNPKSAPKQAENEAEYFTSFHYHACAHAFSGGFTRPFHELIDAQASSSLPTIGGHGNAHVDCFRFREWISFKRGYSHVSGSHQTEDNSNNTLVNSTVEGLNVLDILTADRLVARMYSKHPYKAPEGFVTMVGSKFENLRIAGYPVHLELDTELFEGIRNYTEAQLAFKNNPAFRKIAQDPFDTGRHIDPPGPNGAFLCSIVKKIDTDYPGVTRKGHSFHVQGFGTVFLGEVLIAHGQRTLNMIRLDLGSSNQGTGTVGAADVNGRHWP